MATYKLIYEPESNSIFEGNEDELYARLSNTKEDIDDCIYPDDECTTNTWFLSKLPTIKIIEIINGINNRSVSPEKYLHKTYGLSEISEETCKELVNQLNSGKVNFDDLF